MLPTGKFFIIQNKKGYLEGGPLHFVRPLDQGTEINSTYIRWSFIPFNKGYTIQCKVNGHYLDGGPKHMWRKSTGTHPKPDFITWLFVPTQDGFLIKNKATENYLTAGPAGTSHMGPKSEGVNSNLEPITWVLWSDIYSINLYN